MQGRAPQRTSSSRSEVPFLRLSIVALMVGLAPYSALASWLMPYLLWVAFAAHPISLSSA